ncbi:Ribonuclease HII [Trichinella spiralis]|uniref:Ribonuclease HII n=1 Tax=Trichinella spiralis TaxID=6334 RepID=A0ABR3KYZ5_TRISP
MTLTSSSKRRKIGLRSRSCRGLFDDDGDDNISGEVNLTAMAVDHHHAAGSQQNRLELPEEEIFKVELMYSSRTSQAFVCPCLANLYVYKKFSTTPTPTSTTLTSKLLAESRNDSWDLFVTGIPVLVLDSNQSSPQETTSVVQLQIRVAEYGTGFTLWKHNLSSFSRYCAVDSSFHTMFIGTKVATRLLLDFTIEHIPQRWFIYNGYKALFAFVSRLVHVHDQRFDNTFHASSGQADHFCTVLFSAYHIVETVGFGHVGRYDRLFHDVKKKNSFIFPLLTVGLYLWTDKICLHVEMLVFNFSFVERAFYLSKLIYYLYSEKNASRSTKYLFIRISNKMTGYRNRQLSARLVHFACFALRNVVALNGRSILHQAVLKEDIFCNGNRFPLHLFSSTQSTISKVNRPSAGSLMCKLIRCQRISHPLLKLL